MLSLLSIILQIHTILDRLRVHFEVKLLANQGVLPVDEEESILLRAPISDHEQLELSDDQWSYLRARVKRILQEYLQHRHKEEFQPFAR